MPFTPYHFGPGLLIKSAAPRHVSIVSYAAANMVIDIETLYHLAHHDAIVHRWAHTFVGAAVVGLAVGLIAAVAARVIAAWLHATANGETAPRAVVLGALLGAITHPLFDGLMHPDIHPFAPLTDLNPLRGLVPVLVLQGACIVCGVMGATMLLARRST